MRSLAVLTLLVPFILAVSHEFPPWTPPSAGDVRCPCPALNTLANHGLIPHSGRGLSVRMLQKALGNTYNVGLDISTVFGLGGLLTSPHPFKGTFDLSDLKKHNFIEHDASLSRADVGVTGDAVTFQPAIWQSVVEQFGGLSNTSIQTAARAWTHRVASAKAQNANIKFGAKQKLMSLGETALYLSAMGGLSTGEAPVEWVDIWFSQERLPVAEGWTPSKTTINFLRLNILLAKVAWASRGESSGIRVEQELKKEL